MPGEPPNDAAQRRRERAERLAGTSALAPSAGSARATARALTELPSGWTVLNDVVWPGRRGARIDHVVIGPAGVFVIASQSWAGAVSIEDDVLREDGRSRERAVASVAEAALQVGQLASRLAITQPVIVFATEERVSGRAREVAICSTGALVEMLTSRAQVLNTGQVRQVASELREKFRAAAAALGPVIPGPRAAPEDTPRPIAPPSTPQPSPRPSRTPEPRIRITGTPARASADRSAERERAARERTIRIALLTLVVVALLTAVVFAGDIGDLIARLLT